MDDRAKAVVVVAVAAVLGIAGVLAVETVTGLRPEGGPSASIARVEVSASTPALPTPSRSPSATPTLVPTAKPKPTPTAPPWKATWSKPLLVEKEPCTEFGVGIDPASRYHVITSCDGLRYSVTDADGPSTTTSLGDSKAHGPLIAFDGDQAYVAYWRVLPYEPDTCAGPDAFEPSAGVYYRRRMLPDGGWSKAIPFGKRGDHLTAFRVDNGVLHAIVWNETSGTFVPQVETGPCGQHSPRDRRRRRRVAPSRRRRTRTHRLLEPRCAPLRDLRRVRLLDLEDCDWAGPTVRPCSYSARATNRTSSTRSLGRPGMEAAATRKDWRGQGPITRRRSMANGRRSGSRRS